MLGGCVCEGACPRRCRMEREGSLMAGNETGSQRRGPPAQGHPVALERSAIGRPFELSGLSLRLDRLFALLLDGLSEGALRRFDLSGGRRGGNGGIEDAVRKRGIGWR